MQGKSRTILDTVGQRWNSLATGKMKRKPKSGEQVGAVDLNVRIPPTMRADIIAAVMKRREQSPGLHYTLSDFVREKLSEVLYKS